MKINSLKNYLAASLLFVTFISSAQVEGGSANSGPADDSSESLTLEGFEPGAAPIDSNILILAAAGILTGFYFVSKKKTANEVM